MTITRSDALAGKDDEIVHVVGTYLVHNLGDYKLSYLQLSDGASVRLGARPDEELARLRDHRVIATGRLKESWPLPDPNGHATEPNPKPTLLEISEIRVAPGS